MTERAVYLRGCAGKRGDTRRLLPQATVPRRKSDRASNRAKAMELKSTGGPREYLGSKIYSLAAGWIGGWRAGEALRVTQSFPPGATKNTISPLAG